MKTAKQERNLALVQPPQPIAEPKTSNDKLQAAIAWLDGRYVLSPAYKPRVRVGFYLHTVRRAREDKA